MSGWPFATRHSYLRMARGRALLCSSCLGLPLALSPRLPHTLRCRSPCLGGPITLLLRSPIGRRTIGRPRLVLGAWWPARAAPRSLEHINGLLYQRDAVVELIAVFGHRLNGLLQRRHGFFRMLAHWTEKSSFRGIRNCFVRHESPVKKAKRPTTCPPTPVGPCTPRSRVGAIP